ncbi:Fucose 4-O-acetylase [Bacteroidales bacterium Barb6]|nr:Fucose 4-O-acetylase [Bacteroidales bacterium Barb6]
MATDKELQSKVIDFLRFPLIVGVIFIHNYGSTANIPEMASITGHTPVYHICSELFSHILGSVSVPLFFFISGFLFFLNTNFSKQCYIKKLNSRVKTLLVPYLFWNISLLIFCFIISNIPLLSIFPNKDFELSLRYVLEALWRMSDKTHNAAGYPIATQFWFIRDLMVTVVLTPLIYLCVKRTHIYGILLLGIVWLSGRWFEFAGSCGLNVSTLFFFTSGAWFSINRRNLIQDMTKVKYISFIAYPLIVIIDLLTDNLVYDVGTIIGIIFWFNIGHSSVRTTIRTVRKYREVRAMSVTGLIHINNIVLTGVRSQGV